MKKIIIALNIIFAIFINAQSTQTHTLTANEIPSHTIYSSKTMQGIGTNQGNYSLVGNISTTTYGAGAAHNILDPYLTVNFIIKQ